MRDKIKYYLIRKLFNVYERVLIKKAIDSQISFLEHNKIKDFANTDRTIKDYSNIKKYLE